MNPADSRAGESSAVTDSTAEAAELLQLWARAERIAARHPGLDTGGVYHALHNLRRSPTERLRRGLAHGGDAARSRRHAMQVSAAAGTTASQGSGSQDTVAALEKQREQVKQKLTEVAADKTLDATQKQEELALYQLQLQVVDSQIAQIQQQQAQAAQARAARSAAASQAQGSASEVPAKKIDDVSSIVHVVA